MIGIYCCVVSYLLSNAGWKLLKEGEEVVQVARNSVTFKVPRRFAEKLTFLDPLSSYLEVVVELPEIVAVSHSVTLYREISKTFFAAVRRAMQTLSYEVRASELSFLCPEQSTCCSTYPHLAMVNESHELLTCSSNPGSICHPLTPDQKMWLSQGELVQSHHLIVFSG